MQVDATGELVSPLTTEAAPAGSRAWRELKLWGGSLLFACLVGWILGIVWWGVLSPDARKSTQDELIIPPGTAASIARGTGIAFVPGSLSLRTGTSLLVINNDSAEHKIGEYVIPPGATAEITMGENTDEFSCTIHPSGFLGINLTERPSFLTTLVPMAFIGIPAGLTIAACIWIGIRLKDEEEIEPGSEGL